MTQASPCIKLCVIDPDTGLCQGCGRRLDEIAAWGVWSEVERLALMRVLPDRLAASRDAASGRAEVEQQPQRTAVEGEAA